MAKKVVCLDDGVTFDTLTEAGMAVGVSRVAIQRCCKGQLKTAGGKRWAYCTDKLEVVEE